MTELLDVDRDALLRAAVAAPSMHNTQPWRFRFGDRVVEVYRDRERELPAEDPSRRMLHISLGAAILNLRVEAAARGIGLEVRHLVDQRRPHLVAVIELGGPVLGTLAGLAPYLAVRRTNREPFTDQRVPTEVRAQLDLSAWAEGAALQWLDRPSWQWWLRMATNDAVNADDESRARRSASSTH